MKKRRKRSHKGPPSTSIIIHWKLLHLLQREAKAAHRTMSAQLELIIDQSLKSEKAEQ